MAGESQFDGAPRNYSMSDAELIEVATDLVILLTRDQAELAGRGITPATIAALTAQKDAFAAIPTNEYMHTFIDVAIADREAKFAEVQILVEDMRTMMEIVFGEKSQLYKDAGFFGVFSVKDSTFIERLEDIAETAEDHLAALAVEGLTQAMIDELRAKTADLFAAMTAVRSAERNAKFKTNNRVDAGNELWDEIRHRVKTAVTYYKRRNHAKSIEYFDLTRRNSTPQTPPGAIAGMGYDAQAQKAYWNDSATETSYEAEIDDNGVITEVSIGQNVTELAIPMGATMKRFRIRGRNAAGVGPWSPWIEIAAAAQPAKPTNAEYIPPSGGGTGLTKCTVPVGATSVEFWYQADGHPAGQIGFLIDGEYPWTLWLTPGTIMLRAHYPGGIVSDWTTLRVE